MPEATGEATSYTVRWATIHNPLTRVWRVQIIDGYTTTDDIPRIIATRIWGRPSSATEIVINSIEKD